jgi:hypothetical protein
MRPPLAKAVRQEFAQQLAKQLSQFRKTKNGAGYYIYQWMVGPKLCFFVGLQIDSEEDWFTVEVAWNTREEFPGLAFNQSPKEMPKTGGFRMRLGGLWNDTDKWWELAPGWTDEQWESLELELKMPKATPIAKAMKNVKLHVTDAIERLRKHALPYFVKIAKKHGYSRLTV